MQTGEIEIFVEDYVLESKAMTLPFMINSHFDTSEEIRLKYRFLDLRREDLHQQIILRSKIINYLRNRMLNEGFEEFQTPILTSKC